MACKIKQIEKEFVLWCRYMVQKYQGLRIKYCWSSKLLVWLICYYPDEINAELRDTFELESMMYEDFINKIYHDKAPLFCDNGIYFEMHNGASEIK